MKTIQKSMFFAAVAAIFTLGACTKNDVTDCTVCPDTTQTGETVPVEISLRPTGIEVATRADVFEMAQTVPAKAEAALFYADLYVFDSSNTYVGLYKLDTKQEANSTATFELPREVCGTTCKFYVVANLYPAPSLGSNGSLDNILYNPTSLPHNAGTYARLIDPAYWENQQFIMSTVQEVFIEPYGRKTFAEIALARVEAKLAIQLKVADDFSARHDGAALQLTKVRMDNLNSRMYLFRGTGYEAWDRDLTQTCVSENGIYSNLFYLLPKGGNTRPATIVISGIYDYDGDWTTTDDQTPVEYDLPVCEGDVVRNTYYRIDGTITGVGKLNLDATLKVMDWTVPALSEIEIGE
jgi:hypothetical protein